MVRSQVAAGAPSGAPEWCPRSAQLACVLWQEPAQEICFENQVMFPSGVEGVGAVARAGVLKGGGSAWALTGARARSQVCKRSLRG